MAHKRAIEPEKIIKGQNGPEKFELLLDAAAMDWTESEYMIPDFAVLTSGKNCKNCKKSHLR